MADNMTTTTNSFRTVDITHTPRKQFEKMRENYNRVRGFEPVSREFIQKIIDQESGKPDVYVSDEVLMPIQGSSKSVGYDVPSHSKMVIPPKGKVLIWTNLRAYMQDGEVCLGFPRSSMGIKLDVIFANTVSLIDSDYDNNPTNDGNICICLYNRGDANVTIEKGERMAQLAFFPFLRSDNCNTDKVRVGGVGSSGR